MAQNGATQWLGCRYSWKKGTQFSSSPINFKMLNPNAPAFDPVLQLTYCTFPPPPPPPPPPLFISPSSLIYTQNSFVYPDFLVNFYTDNWVSLPPPITHLTTFENRNCSNSKVIMPLVELEQMVKFDESEKSRVIGRCRDELHVGGGRHAKKKSLKWQPKLKHREEFDRLGSSTTFGFHGSEGRTTLMIKNIPNRYSRKMLLDLLDQHCMEENQKAHMIVDAYPSEYDFVYLPMDFDNKCNLGYAFVNFTSAVAASRMYDSFHKHRWKVFKSKKICEIRYARIQGKSSLQGHFRHSYFICDSDEFLPIQFNPPRNGSSCCPRPSVIGTRVSD